jgi:hypothetical protein
MNIFDLQTLLEAPSGPQVKTIAHACSEQIEQNSSIYTINYILDGSKQRNKATHSISW